MTAEVLVRVKKKKKKEKGPTQIKTVKRILFDRFALAAPSAAEGKVVS